MYFRRFYNNVAWSVTDTKRNIPTVTSHFEM